MVIMRMERGTVLACCRVASRGACGGAGLFPL